MKLKDKNSIRLYAYITQTRSLGPFQRFAIWVQGCPLKCPNCMTPDAISEEKGSIVPISELIELIHETPDIEGVTISGGEPFGQADALAKMICKIKQKKDLGIIVYSGYTLETLKRMPVSQPGVQKFLSYIDLLIDGAYVHELNDGLSLRGSSNQKIHNLTERYAHVVNDYYGQANRQVEIQLYQDNIMMLGIPGKEILKKWQAKFSM
ncbi:MAG: radical SAM protein [Desulfobacterales bacterium]|nr:radical SAM protein [Desulfobacterales bacterium]